MSFYPPSFFNIHRVIIFHNHKKQNNSLAGSLDRVLIAIELEFPKILVPRLPQNSSNVNIEYAGKPKQLYSISFIILRALYLYFIILALICFSLIMPTVNSVIYGCSSSKTISGVITIQELHTGGKTLWQLLLKIG